MDIELSAFRNCLRSTLGHTVVFVVKWRCGSLCPEASQLWLASGAAKLLPEARPV